MNTKLLIILTLSLFGCFVESLASKRKESETDHIEKEIEPKDEITFVALFWINPKIIPY